MDMIHGKFNFSNSFLISRNICCRFLFGIASMRQFHCVPTTYVFSINEYFTISFFFKQILNHFNSFIQRNEHIEMNNFSCSLSCTWMTIIDCLFYSSDSLS